MRKYLKYLALFMVLLPLMANAHEIILLPSLQRDTTDVDTIMPTRDVELVEDGVIVTYHFNAATLVSDPLYANCKFWRINGFGTNDAATEPAFPLRVDNFKLPRNATGCQIILLDSTYVDVSMKIAPARPPLSDNDTIGYNLSNVPPISTYSGRFPSASTNNYSTYSYRGVPVVEVCVTPMQYDMGNERVRAFTMLKYKVKYDYSGASQVPAVVPIMSKLSPSDHFLENVTLNAEPIELEGDTAVVDNMDYLIISVNKYEQAVNLFANWKRTLGYRTHVVMRDTWTPAEVFSQVKQLYNQEGVNLYYLLIVGDHEDVPCYNAGTPTDFKYGCMSLGNINDYQYGMVPDLYRGRIPVSSLNDAQNIFDKIINYEMCPPQDTLFYQNALHCAQFQDDNSDGKEDRTFVHTCEELRNHMIAQGKNVKRIYCKSGNGNVLPTEWNNVETVGGLLPNDLINNPTAWLGNTDSIVNGINEGALYAVHRDHGYGSGRGWVNPYFTVNTFPRLNNRKFPVVFSINCCSGYFLGNTCFCEELLKLKEGGCVAAFGATVITTTGPNDLFLLGMFDAMWPGIQTGILPDDRFGESPILSGLSSFVPSFKLGNVMEYGFNYEEMFCLSTDTRKAFHLFGDPSMEMLTDVPCNFENVSIDRHTSSISVSLNETAKISFVNYLTGDVYSYIGKSVNFSALSPNEWTISIYAHNRYPVIDYGDIFIQNEIIERDGVFNGNRIFVGNNVTHSKPFGDVWFNTGSSHLNAREVKLMPGTNIKKGAEVRISTHK